MPGEGRPAILPRSRDSGALRPTTAPGDGGPGDHGNPRESWKGMGRDSMWVLLKLFATLWTAARRAPLSMASSRQEYWSG